MRRIKYIAILLVLCLLAGCAGREVADPYAGMVQVANGYGGQMWIRPNENIPVSDFAAEDFSGGKYTGNDYICSYGIDVSEHQREIDWTTVAADGVDFAIIRAGYRGYSKGGLFEDNYFRTNIEGAAAAGLEVGVYFFSQAVSAEEAIEEAEFLLKLLEDYPGAVTLPVFYDWEKIGAEDARADNLDGTTLTDCALAFCQRIEQAGYEAGIYAYRNLGYFSYELERLMDFSWWIATLDEAPDFYYRHNFWQHSITGSVKGIDGDVDLDMMFVNTETTTDGQ